MVRYRAGPEKGLRSRSGILTQKYLIGIDHGTRLAVATLKYVKALMLHHYIIRINVPTVAHMSLNSRMSPSQSLFHWPPIRINDDETPFVVIP